VTNRFRTHRFFLLPLRYHHANTFAFLTLHIFNSSDRSSFSLCRATENTA
jgi:hypothetical protein